jgi:mono/diheme cytochrome c family protein
MGRIPPGKPRMQVNSRNLAVGALLVIIAGTLTFGALRNAADQMNATSTNVGLGNQISVGQRMYAQHCASCHGANLEGQVNWRSALPDGSMPAPPHDITGHTWHHSDQQLFEITKFGGQAYSPEGYINKMPAFGDRLSDDEIRAVLAYIKSTWPPDIQSAQAQQK